jgi:hypothetical protein
MFGSQVSERAALPQEAANRNPDPPGPSRVSPARRSGIAAPEPLLTQAGKNFAQIENAAIGERRWPSFARWVEGELLTNVVA